ncbi:MAG: DUF4145 domain-containing protein [Bacteroidales bacterium]|nr:DUF4145 domain-containing protein [Bacteroidales bacterium]
MSRINNKIWLVESFSWKNPHPAWVCPICNTGTLKGDKKTIQIEQSQDTLKARRSHNYQADGEAAFRFAGFMVCGNGHCKEKIAIAGNGKLYAAANDVPVSIHYKGERYSVFYPRYFEPPLNIFPIYDSCPIKIQEQIKVSFTHYFNDLSASANSIRTALELIMDDQRVNKTKTSKKGERIKLTLHARISYFGQKYPDLKPFLIATKWIGNAGSHVGDVSKEDLLDGYDLLQHCIEELYDKPVRLKELSTKAKSINKMKKPRSSKKKITGHNK